jgi:hypothetical protein
MNIAIGSANPPLPEALDGRISTPLHSLLCI